MPKAFPLEFRRDVVAVARKGEAPIAPIAKDFADLGFTIYATAGTAAVLAENGIAANILHRIHEGRPNVLDMIKNGEISFIINTPSGEQPRLDEIAIRSAAVASRVATMTTLRGARASADAIRSLRDHGLSVKSLQEYHA